MNVDCKDRERVLQEQEVEALAALGRHTESCAACARELRAWNEISVAAKALRKRWESPELWPRIRRALAEQAETPARHPLRTRFGWLWHLPRFDWRLAGVVVALLAMTATTARILSHRPAVVAVPDSQRRLLTEQAVEEVERSEVEYEKSIEKLSKLLEPRIERPTTPLDVAYREKLLLIDAAIQDCRANIERNRWNAHLRNELLSIYQEKQRTLIEMQREE